jgi:hypothetical protein
MNLEKEDGSDQRSEPITNAFLVDPNERTVRRVAVAGYEGICALFEKEYDLAFFNLKLGEYANLEGSTICKIEDNIYLHSWADCHDFMTAPAWRTSLAPSMPMHGLTLIDAYDLSTGEAVDIPLCPKCFGRTIEWEDFENRREFERPNKEWADKGGYEWAVGDREGNIHASGSTWEDAAQDA